MVWGAVVVGGLWVFNRPPGLDDRYVWGELGGVLAVYLLTWSLVLATRALWMEPWFGGLDRMYLCHKRSAIAAALLLPPHVLLAGAAPHASEVLHGVALGWLSGIGLLTLVLVSLPRVGRILRLPYERWLVLHRLAGLCVIVGVFHGLTVGRVISTSALLKAVVLLIGIVGVAAYAYEELLMRRRVPTADYLIAQVGRPAADIVEIGLIPVGYGIRAHAGQFVLLRIGGDRAYREHPFSIAGATSTGHLRLCIRALGRDTRRMHAQLAPGLPATITGPYGRFDSSLGGQRQIWIAGGVGVAPFLGWLQTLRPEGGYSVDLFYSVPSQADAVYLPELQAASERLPGVRIHPIFTRSRGRLTGAEVAASIEPASTDVHIFLCGPLAMVKNLTRDLRRHGLPRDHIHFEHSSFR